MVSAVLTGFIFFKFFSLCCFRRNHQNCVLIEFQCFHGSNKSVIIPQRITREIDIPFFQHSNIFKIFNVKGSSKQQNLQNLQHSSIFNVTTSSPSQHLSSNAVQETLIPSPPPPFVHQKIRHVLLYRKIQGPSMFWGTSSLSPMMYVWYGMVWYGMVWHGMVMVW